VYGSLDETAGSSGMKLMLASFPFGLAFVMATLALPMRPEAQGQSIGQNCFADRQ
jgi:hypothetical protein